MQAAEQLRPLWRAMHEQHSYPEYDAEWKHIVHFFACATRMVPMPPRKAPLVAVLPLSNESAPSGEAQSTAFSSEPAVPHPADATAMLMD